MKTLWKAVLLICRAWFYRSSLTGGNEVPARAGLAQSGAWGEQWRRFKALIRMLRAWSAGRYTQAPSATVAMGALALVYLVSPIDVISDFIPLIGLLDDVTVVALVLSAVGRDLETFRNWEDAKRKTIHVEYPAGAVS